MAFIGAQSAIDLSAGPRYPGSVNFYGQNGNSYWYGTGGFGEELDFLVKLSGSGNKVKSVAYWFDGSAAFYINKINLSPNRFTQKAASGIKGLLDGKDTVVGSDSADIILGEGKNDLLIGNAGNDRILGGSGKDKLFGESGNDTLIGGSGKDLMTGGQGRDTFVLQRGASYDIIRDFSNADTITVKGYDDDNVRVVERRGDAFLYANRDLLARVNDGAGLDVI